VLGDPEKALEYYARALTIDPAFYERTGIQSAGVRSVPAGALWARAMLGRYEQEPGDVELPWVKAFTLSRSGRYREAEELLAGQRARFTADQNDRVLGYLHLESAVLSLDRREYRLTLSHVQDAQRAVERLPADDKRVPLMLANLLAGLASVGTGRLEAALSYADAVTRSCVYSTAAEKWWCGVLQAEIALARGDLDGAARQFAAAEPAKKMWFLFNSAPTTVFANGLLARDGLARVHRARGDLDAAIASYRQLLSVGPAQKWTAPLEPRYVLEIARSLERKGDRKAALGEYERFLEFWKDADPELPELNEARKAVVRLGSAPAT
jgi:tetratricopeptide (TPR) repeat protein